MKTLHPFCFLALIFSVSACKSQKPIPINNAVVYSLTINKGNYITTKDSLQYARLMSYKKDENCDARFETSQSQICFKYFGKPTYQVLLKNQNTDSLLGSISNIKKFESTLRLSTDETYILKPLKGDLTMLYRDLPIARVSVKKRKYTLEIDKKHFSNEVLKAAILYKHGEYQKMNYDSGSEFILLLLLISAL